MDVAKRALYGGLAGWIAIDLYMSAVYLLLGSTPLRLFQWDASTVLGASSYAGGWASAALGLVLDYAVSLGWAVIALLVLSRSAAARRRPLLFGLIYGLAVMFVMIWAIVPLTPAHQAAKNVQSIVIVVVGHTLFFGVPLVWAMAPVRARAAG